MGEVNGGTCASYGMDPWSQQLKRRCKELFGCLDSFLVFNGTAANVLCVQTALSSYQSVLCSHVAHLNMDECGAPEKITGCRIVGLEHSAGKLSVETIERALIRKGDQHFSQAKMVSLTQPTELGTTYSLEEISAIKDLCYRHNLFLHIDGARLSNSAVTLNTNFKEICALGDIVSFGGTKNGLMAGELVLIFNEELLSGFKFYRKQSLQLPSKTRFFAAAFLEYLKEASPQPLWHSVAEHSVKLAQNLSHRIQSETPLSALYPVQSNAVFCQLPKPWIKSLRQNFFFYVWDPHTSEVRLMTSFDTKEESVDQFITALKTLEKSQPMEINP